jgi:hypothetical protein
MLEAARSLDSVETSSLEIYRRGASRNTGVLRAHLHPRVVGDVLEGRPVVVQLLYRHIRVLHQPDTHSQSRQIRVQQA